MAACGRRPQPPEPVTPARASADPLAAAHNAWCLERQRHLAGEGEGNLLWSPTTVWMVAAMLAVGARGSSAAALAAEVGLPPPSADLAPRLSALSRDIKRASRAGVELRLTCAGWVDDTLRVRPEYRALLDRWFGSPLFAFPRGDGQALDRAVDAWVTTATDRRISDLDPLAGEGIPRLVVASAAYLNAPWEEPFDESWTRDAPFHTEAGERRRVPFMHRVATLPYARAFGADALELPYRGGRLAMLILAPNRGALPAFEQALDETRLAAILACLAPAEVVLAMPRWSARWHNVVGDWLVDLDQRLGELDLSGAFGAPAGAVTQSRLVQAASITVSEQGTEVAAVASTSVEGLLLPDPGQVAVTLDRPFCYLIRDRVTGVILFAGRVGDPTATGVHDGP